MRCSVVLGLALCLLAFAACEARTTKAQRVLSESRALSHAQTQTRDNSVFFGKLKALDAERLAAAAADDAWSLLEKCYLAYQKDLYVHSDFSAYGNAYATEFGKVWDALAAVYNIGSWESKKSLNKKDLVSKMVTGTLSKPKNQPCPLVPVSTGVTLRKGDCITAKMVDDFLEYDSKIDCKKVNKEFVKAQYPKQVAEVTADATPKATPPKAPVTHTDKPTEKQLARREKRQRNYARKLDIMAQGKCNFLVTEFDYFIRLEPKDKPSCPSGNLMRVSISLKPSDPTRPAALFPILKAVMLNAGVQKVLQYAKIETMAQRQDAILLQLCYDPTSADTIKATTDLLDALSSELKQTYSAVISDDGPYVQKPHGVFFIADYTARTSFGRDLCCMWYGADSTEDFQKFVGLVSAAAPVLKFAPEWVTTVTAEGSTCDWRFDPAKLASIGPDTKLADVKA